MQTFIFEATHDAEGTGNYGKFMVGVFGSEWEYRSAVDPSRWPFLHDRGWSRQHILVLDLEAGEGIIVRAGGHAHADLCKQQVYVCPLFEPWLAWLHGQLRGSKDILGALKELPPVVYLPDAVFALYGYRRHRTCGTGWPG